jgi:cell surface protein SprA
VGVVKPQFAPLAPDIEFDRYIDEAFPAGKEQDSVRNVQQEVVTRKSLNFTNVRKERTNNEKKKKVYDISNFAVNYSFSSTEKRDFETEFDNLKSYRGGLSYNFSTAPKNIKPFTKSKMLSSTKWLSLVKDMNFYLYPKSYTFSTNVNRQYQESKTRNNNPELKSNIPVYVNKTFDWNRNYSVRWDLTRAIKLDFTARNKSLIRETKGQKSDSLPEWNETVKRSVMEFGTNLKYNHGFNLTWAVPINKIPILDWTTTTFKYGSTYSWDRAPFIVENLGNTIQNTQTMQLNGALNFVNLYNKSKYLKKVNSKRPGVKKKKAPKNPADTTKSGKPKKDGPPAFVDGLARLVMMVRKGNASYARTNGIMLPGYNNETEVLGMNSNFSAPGLGFVFGQQDGFGDSKDYLDYARENNWLVTDTNFNNQYRQTSGEKLNLKLTIEPIRDFRVELNTTWNDAKSYTTFNRFYDEIEIDGVLQDSVFVRDSPLEQGTFTSSFSMIRTAFEQTQDAYVSSAFENFSENRSVVSTRIGKESEALGYSDGEFANGYYDGYGPNHSDVLIPSLLAAYSGKSAESVSTNIFSKMYIPNVRLTYNGLGKISVFKKYVRSISISSGYKSSYIVGGYTSNIRFDDDDENGDMYTDARDTSSLYNNFVAKYNYTGITLRESFSPLINVDVTLKNTVQVRFGIKKDRTINLSTRSLQVMEIRGQELTLGLGYTFKQLRAPFQDKRKRNAIKSDLKVRADFSIRKSLSITRELDTEINPNNPTNGQTTMTLKLTGDYKLSRKLTLRLFFDYISNTPVISLSYPNSTTNGGFSIRFNLNG